MRYEYVPPNDPSRIDHVGTYKRAVPVSLERMYENALDWEHLPHLHASSFTTIDCIDSGGWGWRATVDSAAGARSTLELRLDRSCRRWITRNLEGPSVGAEIWTHVFENAPRELDLVIDFFVPNVPDEAREKVGMAYARAYETLYDEDVWMMTERQAAIDKRIDTLDADAQLVMTTPQEDQLPFAFELSGRGYMLNRHGGSWVTYPQACPHQQGPLAGGIDANGELVCPWHGYRFDVATGECTTGGSCRFGQRPEVVEDGATLTLRFAP